MEKPIDLLKTTFSQWNSREGQCIGAYLTFQSILFLAPLVILVAGDLGAIVQNRSRPDDSGAVSGNGT